MCSKTSENDDWDSRMSGIRVEKWSRPKVLIVDCPSTKVYAVVANLSCGME